jgi:hypothetical protein
MFRTGDPTAPKEEVKFPEFSESYQATLFLSYVGDDWLDVSYIVEQLILDDYRFAYPELFSDESLDKTIDNLCYFKGLKTRIHKDKEQIKLPDMKKPGPISNVINAQDRFGKDIRELRAA